MDDEGPVADRWEGAPDPGEHDDTAPGARPSGDPALVQIERKRRILDSLFGDEVRAGVIETPLHIRAVWKNAYSENSNWKLWAAKFAARHRNLIAMEVNSFRCGHDATVFSVIEGIVEASGTPFFSFRDLDENKPSGSIKSRIETVDYFLKRFRERLVSEGEVRARIEDELCRYREAVVSRRPQEAPLVQLRREGTRKADAGPGDAREGAIVRRGA